MKPMQAFLFLLSGNFLLSHAAQYNAITNFPYFVSIEVNGQYACPGTIVDEFYVLTSTTCLKSLDLTKDKAWVRASTDRLMHRGQALRVVSITPDRGTDLAMVKVATTFTFDITAWPLNPNNIGINEGDIGVLPYWSSQSHSSQLSSSSVYVMNITDCSQAYSGFKGMKKYSYCLAPLTSSDKPCMAGLGTPLYYNEQLYGVVVQNPGCSSNLPLVVQKLVDHTKFIIDTLSGGVFKF